MSHLHSCTSFLNTHLSLPCLRTTGSRLSSECSPNSNRNLTEILKHTYKANSPGTSLNKLHIHYRLPNTAEHVLYATFYMWSSLPRMLLTPTNGTQTFLTKALYQKKKPLFRQRLCVADAHSTLQISAAPLANLHCQLSAYQFLLPHPTPPQPVYSSRSQEAVITRANRVSFKHSGKFFYSVQINYLKYLFLILHLHSI